MKNNWEIPFNFKKDWFTEAKPYIDYIECVYLPIFERGHTTREWIGCPEWNKYLDNIRKIQDLGLKPSLLIQKDSSEELIEKYYNLGVKDFIINDDDLATKIKQDFTDVYLRLSIMRWSVEDVKKDLPYDNICLPYYYNRHFDEITKLPKKNYTLLVNATCLWDCPWFQQHGFTGKHGTCGNLRFNKIGGIRYGNISYIPPKQLDLFKPYIKTFKLQGRDFSSKLIFDDLEKYIKNPSI